jgi:hypothetical protein
MHDDKTKEKLLKDIAQLGIIYLSCIKIGVDKSTYYRWKEKDKKFKKLADEAERIGNENICDVAESMLVQNIKKGDQRAIEFTLIRRSKKYKPKKETSNVVIMHKKNYPIPEPIKTLEDFIADDEEEINKQLNEIKERFEKMGGVPPKADGSKISFEELGLYEKYIEEWYKKKEQVKTKISTDTADSESLSDKPEVKLLENHKTQDTSHLNSANHHTAPDNKT